MLSISLEVSEGTITMLVLGVGVEIDDNSKKRPGAQVLIVPMQAGYEAELEREAVWVMNGAKNLVHIEVCQVRTYPFLFFCICRTARPTALQRRGQSR
jgi:hypothetical protein